MKDITDFNAQKMHMQMHGQANFRDVVRYREMLRRRKIFLLLDAIAIISLVIGYFLFKTGYYINSYIAFGITILIILYFVLRKLGKKRNIGNKKNFRHNHNSRKRKRR